jgi:3-deoxy-D-manno-octulosonic acid kinase
VKTRPPDGYERVSSGAAEAFALGGLSEWAGSVLAGGTLHAWAGARPGAIELRGRGAAYSVAAETGDAVRWVVRHYRRGGAVASLLGDRYLAVGTPRPWTEARASAEARARGIPTPHVVAGAIYPAGLFYRADLLTEEVAEARPLAGVVFGPDAANPAGRAAALRAAGRLARRLSDARVVHRDLNANNILLVGAEGPFEAHAIDLDGCRTLPLDGPPVGRSMIRRLERSLRKLGGRAGSELTDGDWASLAEGAEAHG